MTRPFEQQPCPYGDVTCPCQDGDPCHYEPFEETPAIKRITPVTAEPAMSFRDAALIVCRSLGEVTDEPCSVHSEAVAACMKAFGNGPYPKRATEGGPE